MTGYLCTLSYFSKDQLYQIFKLTDLHEKIILLIRYYSNFIRVLNENWNNLANKG